MSKINITAFIAPNYQWKKMKAVWDACIVAGIEIPTEVHEYFNGTEPSMDGVEVNIYHCIDELPNSEWKIHYGKLPKNLNCILINIGGASCGDNI